VRIFCSLLKPRKKIKDRRREIKDMETAKIGTVRRVVGSVCFTILLVKLLLFSVLLSCPCSLTVALYIY
jgi:hypothetical protein